MPVESTSRTRGSSLGLVPLLGLLWLAYNASLLLGLAPTDLGRPVASVPLPSGTRMEMSLGHILIALGVLALYGEMLKATRIGSASVAEHTLSVVVFVAFLIELVTLPGAGTATFFILTLMSLLDVVAGFAISIFTARRDITIDRPVE